jgi:predicted nucleic-acid-binding protein
MRAVDTNVLVRLLARDHPAQVAAAEAFVQAGAWVGHIVLVESIWVLDSVYELPSDKIALGVEMLLDHDNLVVQDADVVRAALSTFRKRPALGFSDCLILEVARKAGHVPVGTFGRRFARMPDTQKLG